MLFSGGASIGIKHECCHCERPNPSRYKHQIRTSIKILSSRAKSLIITRKYPHYTLAFSWHCTQVCRPAKFSSIDSDKNTGLSRKFVRGLVACLDRFISVTARLSSLQIYCVLAQAATRPRTKTRDTTAFLSRMGTRFLRGDRPVCNAKKKPAYSEDTCG